AAGWLGAEQHGVGGGSAVAQRGICGDESGGLDDSLPYATSYDESDVFDGRADDAARGNAGGRGDAARHGDYEWRCGYGRGKWAEHGARDGCGLDDGAACGERDDDGAAVIFAASGARNGRDADGAGRCK